MIKDTDSIFSDSIKTFLVDNYFDEFEMCCLDLPDAIDSLLKRYDNAFTRFKKERKELKAKNEELKKQVDCNQTDDLEVYTYEILNGYYKYHNSVYGIMDAMNQNYSNLDLDINELQDKISNPESLSLVKDILTKMG